MINDNSYKVVVFNLNKGKLTASNTHTHTHSHTHTQGRQSSKEKRRTRASNTCSKGSLMACTRCNNERKNPTHPVLAGQRTTSKWSVTFNRFDADTIGIILCIFVTQQSTSIDSVLLITREQKRSQRTLRFLRKLSTEEKAIGRGNRHRKKRKTNPLKVRRSDDKSCQFGDKVLTASWRCDELSIWG